MIKAVKLFLGIAGIAAIAACSGEKSKQSTLQKPVAISKLPEPFRFHKAIEVKPGLTFDVLSWGRGSELTGGLLILRSDSVNLKYRSVSDQLEGKANDAWNMDMDSDGNPEIFITTDNGDKHSQLKVYVYEFNDSGSAQQLRFPELSASTRKVYRGKDSLYIKNGNLYREFPVYAEQDTAGTKPEGKKILEYTLKSNNFIVKEIKEETDKSGKK